MDFKININAIIPALTLVQGITFATLLILRGRREERHSDFWLAFLLILLGLTGVPFMLGWLGITYLWEQLTFLPWDGLGFASVPTMYLFLRSLVNSEWRFSWQRDGKHYALYIFYFTYHLLIGGYGQIDKGFVDWWWHQVEGLPGVVVLWDLLNYGQEFFYFFLCYRLYKAYRAWTVNEFSDVERVSFRWFYNFLVVHFSVVLVQFFNNLWLRLVNYSYAEMWAIYITEMILVYYISISGYAQARVKEVHFTRKAQILLENTSFLGQNDQNTDLSRDNREGVVETISAIKIEEEEQVEGVNLEKIDDLSTTFVDNLDNLEETTFSEKENIPPKDESKAVRDADLAHWKRKVLAYFEKEKAYLNPELTLSELASKLDTNTSVLSAVINTGFGKNFNDFVNEYRVEEFKRKAAAPDSKHLTLLAIAFDCGFNSKATFNRAFKKVTDVSPKAFLDL
jgi:AraC-like DNA-binding protein